ncbi:MAG: glycosyltransferase family 2 protein [Pirellulales bacterium]
MQLAEITPMILTFNEAANLRRTLEAVSWAKQILIVDSFSTDETLSIVADFPQATVVQRAFDHFADQCNFGLKNIQTDWVLSMDADYVCSIDLSAEIESLEGDSAGYQAAFLYGIYGKNLRACLYPPRTVLYQRVKANYLRDGHAHRVQIDGQVSQLRSRIIHDDRKPLSNWLRSQLKYAEHEAEKLLRASISELGWKDRIRKRVFFAPWLTLLYCLFAKRLILDGRAGIYYTLQRVFAELVLSLTLLDRMIRK